MKRIIFLLSTIIFLVSCNAMYPVSNYKKNQDGTYTRKTDENGKPIKRPEIVVVEIIEEGKKFNYNPQK